MRLIYAKRFYPALAAVLAGLIISLGAGCSDRERLNPLDPANPDHPGENAISFNARAGNGLVLLNWNELDNFEDLDGIMVQRYSAADGDTVQLTEASLPLSATSFSDNTVENGNTYYYNLQFILEGTEERPKSSSDMATPGSVFPWVEWYDYGEITLMTPDYRDEINTLDASFYSIRDFQVEPGAEEIWILDGAAERIYRYDYNGELINQGGALSSVNAFMFSEVVNKVWIAVGGSNGLIYEFSRGNGQLLDSYSTGLLTQSIAVDNARGIIWLGSTEPRIGRLEPLSEDFSTLTSSEFVQPEGVVVGRNQTGSVWVLDTGSKRAYLVGDNGIMARSGYFVEPYSMAVNSDGTLCWVADHGGDTVYEIDMQGNFTAQVTGLGRPWSLTYNHESDEVIVSTEQSSSIVCMAPGGTVKWTLRKPDKPGIIALHYFQRAQSSFTLFK